MYIQNRDAGDIRTLYIGATDRLIRNWYCGLGVGSLSLKATGIVGYL